MAYRDFVRELAGAVPRLSVIHAQRLVNRAWHEILDMRAWSFLTELGDLYTPPLISAGNATVTKWSDQVVLDASAAAAVDAVAISYPPVSSPILGVGRQFRMGGRPLYNILAWDSGTQTLTLDRRWVDADETGPYQIYRAYYAPPTADFLYYSAVWNPKVGYGIIRQALTVDQVKLNALDAKRGAMGDSYYLSPMRPGGRGDNPVVHEFYPHPTTETTYQGYYVRRGWDLSPTQDIPVSFPEYLLMHKAYIHAYKWALANIATYPELEKTNWVLLEQSRSKEFLLAYKNAQRQDDELMPRLPVRIAKWYSFFPLGGQWAQSHALPLTGASL